MDVARVLLVGRNQHKETGFASALKKRYSVTIVSTGDQAVEVAQAEPLHIVVLDAVSMRTTGERICRKLKAEITHLPIIHIHPGPQKAADSPGDVLLFAPFTSRKLINSIERLIKLTDDKTLICGPFALNLGRRVLTTDKQEEVPLTPKAAMLLELFFRQPGQVVERRTLMEQIWNTDYMGDTRTLDVHIRWIRQAIELNPSAPMFLKTVRGVGYRFDVPGQSKQKG